MRCDWCEKTIPPIEDDGQPGYNIREHGLNPSWHIHLCRRCAHMYDRGVRNPVSELCAAEAKLDAIRTVCEARQNLGPKTIAAIHVSRILAILDGDQQ